MPARAVVRRRLLSEREQFVAGPAGPQAQSDLARELRGVVAELEPQCLGLYWPQRGEFNAPAVLLEDEKTRKSRLALPFAQRTPREMHYRLWDGRSPALVDECGIAASAGSAVVPDVVLVPCLGFTDDGFRLGYGGGYFDRWLALHPDVCAIGVAWFAARLDAADLVPMAHDMPLALVVTERGTI
jgi:5-formyltetrahydrofolate cyclo-ligase